MSDLKPCLRCGSKKIHLNDSFSERPYYKSVIKCKNCGISMFGSMDDIEKLKERWNYRPMLENAVRGAELFREAIRVVGDEEKYERAKIKINSVPK